MGVMMNLDVHMSCDYGRRVVTMSRQGMALLLADGAASLRGERWQKRRDRADRMRRKRRRGWL
jgi:hypothetical protein